MRIFHRQAVCFVLVLPLLAGCSESVTDPGKVVSISRFPSTIGTNWTYSVTDSLTLTSSVITITVTDSASLTGGTPGVVWSVQGGGLNQSKFVALLADGIRIQESSRNEFLSEDIKLPMTTGDSWQQVSAREFDSSVVPFLGAVSTISGTFQISARVERVWGFAFGDRLGESVTWIAEDVGIVYRHLIEYSPTDPTLIITHEVWDLSAHQVN
ncbi:MAG: hypothetical protein ACE5GA_00485 [Candidatus Zixiibacteriota bacterium]